MNWLLGNLLSNHDDAGDVTSSHIYYWRTAILHESMVTFVHFADVLIHPQREMTSF